MPREILPNPSGPLTGHLYHLPDRCETRRAGQTTHYGWMGMGHPPPGLLPGLKQQLLDLSQSHRPEDGHQVRFVPAVLRCCGAEKHRCASARFIAIVGLHLLAVAPTPWL